VTTLLHSAIIIALDAVAPVKPYRPKKSIFSWWNTELEELGKVTLRSQDFARRQPNEADRWTDYRDNRRKLKLESLKARCKSWKNFTEEQVSPHQAAKLHKILQRKAYNKLSQLRKDDDSMTETIAESHSILMAEHFPGSVSLGTQNPKTTLGAAEYPTDLVMVDKKPWINYIALD
jgi:hypothetical protein